MHNSTFLVGTQNNLAYSCLFVYVRLESLFYSTNITYCFWLIFSASLQLYIFSMLFLVVGFFGSQDKLLISGGSKHWCFNVWIRWHHQILGWEIWLVALACSSFHHCIFFVTHTHFCVMGMNLAVVNRVLREIAFINICLLNYLLLSVHLLNY